MNQSEADVRREIMGFCQRALRTLKSLMSNDFHAEHLPWYLATIETVCQSLDRTNPLLKKFLKPKARTAKWKGT